MTPWRCGFREHADACSLAYRSSYIASLTKTVLEYRREKSRHKNAQADYSFLADVPSKDEPEQGLDMMHELCLEMLHWKLYQASIHNG